MLESSGAVPVVIKSLIFPAHAGIGRESKEKGMGQAHPPVLA